MRLYSIRRYLKTALSSLMLCCLIVFEAHAYYNPVSEYEISLLPHYLQVKVKSFLGMKTDKIMRDYKRYEKQLGKSVYSPLHHYGLGLIYFRRVQTRMNYPKRSFDLNSAAREFTFTIKHSPKKSFVLYEVYYKRGEIHLLKGEISNAMKDFKESIKLKPAFFNSYLMLSECYRRIGDLKNAKAILEIGRSHAIEVKKNGQ